jgi:hypothetical protein
LIEGLVFEEGVLAEDDDFLVEDEVRAEDDDFLVEDEVRAEDELEIKEI